MLEGGPLKSDWFAEVSKTVVPYLNVATHIETTPDEGMLDKKGGSGFPYVVFMDQEGAILKKIRTFDMEKRQPFDQEMLAADKKDAEQELAKLNALREKAKNAPDDKAAAATAALEIGMRFGRSLGTADLVKLAETPGLDEDLVKRFKAFGDAAKVQDLMSKAVKLANASGDSNKAREMLRTGYLEFVKQGIRLPAGHMMMGSYLSFAMQGATKAKDLKGAKAVVSAAKDNVAGAGEGSGKTQADKILNHFNSLLQKLRDSIDEAKEDTPKEDTPEDAPKKADSDKGDG